MKYIKFLAKCILAATPAILLIAYTLLMPMCYMDEEYPSWRYSKCIASGKENPGVNYKTVILGDSGAMSSYVPSVLSPDGTCVNLAVGGGTSIEMYYLLKEYLGSHEAPENVVIMFTPFHYTHIDNYDTRTMYFKTLSVKDARELYMVAKYCEADKVYNPNVFWDELACRCGLPTKYLPAITASHLFGRYSDNTNRYNNIVSMNGYGTFGTADGCDGLSYECAYTGLDFDNNFELLSAYFKLIMQICEENNISVLVVQEAMNETSFNALDENYYNEYSLYLEVFKQLYPNALIETQLRCYPNEYFGDVSHLNEKGAVIFSQEIVNQHPEFFE